MKKRMKLTAVALAGALALALSWMPTGSTASEEGTRNVAYGLGAATVYFMLNKRPTESLVGAAATGVALHELQRKINNRHEREKQQAVSAARSSGSSSSTRTVSNSSAARPAGNTAASSASTRDAYDRGVSDGYRKGYAAGYELGLERGQALAVRQNIIHERNNGSNSDTLSRVLVARR